MTPRLRNFGGAAATLILLVALVSRNDASELRRTAEVRAVEKARPAIVNIRGHKTVRSDDSLTGGSREVNGMGTGVVIDERGYIITNFHVVDSVRQIEVTTADGTTHTGRLVSHDPKTDLAIIKIDPREKLQTITLGTSTDLMPAEPVIAVGNAFGYEHTVTRGIISALHRNVQVSDTQSYSDLIQTDASINPGNSGGPLLNIDGEMVGINVAVRAGAQGIGFAIPVDNAMAVVTKLLSTERVSQTHHGLVLAAGKTAVVEKVVENSPAAKADVQPGDVVKRIGELDIVRPLDVERALIGREPGKDVAITVERGGKPVELKLALARLTARPKSLAERVWDQLGLKLAVVSAQEVRERRTRYNGGLKVLEVRADGPAKRQGIRPGDVLVGIHVWEMISLDNVEYVLSRNDLGDIQPLKFYIVRDGETLAGKLPVETVLK